MAVECLLIDPATRTLCPTLLSDIEPTSVCRAIGAQCFDAVRITNTHIVVVDDEGSSVPGHHSFRVLGVPHPLAGRALVLSFSGAEWLPPTINIAALATLVQMEGGTRPKIKSTMMDFTHSADS